MTTQVMLPKPIAQSCGVEPTYQSEILSQTIRVINQREKEICVHDPIVVTTVTEFCQYPFSQDKDKYIRSERSLW